MANMTKRDLVIELSNRRGLKHSEVEGLIDDFMELLAARLGEGRDISLRGFGTLELRISKSKIGRNPKRPGSEIVIPDRCTVRFKPGRELKDRVARLPVDVLAANKGAANVGAGNDSP